MFWMTKKVREDLKERFQDDYPKVKWVLALYPLIWLMLPFNSLMFSLLPTFTSQIPRQYGLVVVIVLAVLVIVALFLVVIAFLYLMMSLQYKISARIYKSLYLKRALYTQIMGLVIFLLVLCVIINRFSQWYVHWVHFA